MSKVNVNSIGPSNPVVPVNIEGPSQPTFLGVPICYPVKPDGTTQSVCAIYGGSGAPNNAQGNNGDFYFRSDGGAGTSIYQRRAGSWVGLV